MAWDLTGLGSVADLAGTIISRFFPPAATEQEKAAAAFRLQKLLEDRESRVLDTQRAVITAEMNQSDSYTKRARPTIVYFGLLAIGLVHVVLPMMAWVALVSTGKPLADMPQITLPSEFWYTWGGVCSIWIIGRSTEKHGVVNRLTTAITGSK